MDQAANIYSVAEDIVRQRGHDAYIYLRDKAEIAKMCGDFESAITWWDISLAALEIIRSSKRCCLPNGSLPARGRSRTAGPFHRY